VPGRLIYVVRSWPRLSQTFILNEVLALERLGVELEVFAMTGSGEDVVQPQVAAVRAPVTYLDDRERGWRARVSDHLTVAAKAPLRYASALRFARRNPDLSSGYFTCSTLQCLGQAMRISARVYRARRAGAPVAHLHAHFAHDPALIALLTTRLTGLRYSVTAHARDLYQIPARSLSVRAAGATSVLTCCRANAEYLREVLSPSGARHVRVVHHGVQLDRFTAVDGRAVGDVTKLLSVGRLVEKKGFPDLLRACAQLQHDGLRFHLDVYGDGPLRRELICLRDELKLAEVVDFIGERDNDVVLQALRSADVFVLTPFVTADGDRDGVPNVVVEAMACGLAVVATTAGGVPEIVEHGCNGLLAEPHDVAGIARHLAYLLTDSEARARLGRAARRTVEEGYDVDAAAGELVGIFGMGGAAS